jgi:hypothetical protein
MGPLSDGPWDEEIDFLGKGVAFIEQSKQVEETSMEKWDKSTSREIRPTLHELLTAYTTSLRILEGLFYVMKTLKKFQIYHTAECYIKRKQVINPLNYFLYIKAIKALSCIRL